MRLRNSRTVLTRRDAAPRPVRRLNVLIAPYSLAIPGATGNPTRRLGRSARSF
jgi:hypothetical protein